MLPFSPGPCSLLYKSDLKGVKVELDPNIRSSMTIYSVDNSVNNQRLFLEIVSLVLKSYKEGNSVAWVIFLTLLPL